MYFAKILDLFLQVLDLSQDLDEFEPTDWDLTVRTALPARDIRRGIVTLFLWRPAPEGNVMRGAAISPPCYAARDALAASVCGIASRAMSAVRCSAVFRERRHRCAVGRIRHACLGAPRRSF